MGTRLGVRSPGWQGDVAGGGAGRRASRIRTGAGNIPTAQAPATEVPERGPGAGPSPSPPPACQQHFLDTRAFTLQCQSRAVVTDTGAAQPEILTSGPCGSLLAPGLGNCQM